MYLEFLRKDVIIGDRCTFGRYAKRSIAIAITRKELREWQNCTHYCPCKNFVGSEQKLNKIFILTKKTV